MRARARFCLACGARLRIAEEDGRRRRRGFPTLTAIYRVALMPGALRCGDDVSEARWFPEDEIPFRRVAFASMRRALRTCLRVSRR